MPSAAVAALPSSRPTESGAVRAAKRPCTAACWTSPLELVVTACATAAGGKDLLRRHAARRANRLMLVRGKLYGRRAGRERPHDRDKESVLLALCLREAVIADKTRMRLCIAVLDISEHPAIGLLVGAPLLVLFLGCAAVQGKLNTLDSTYTLPLISLIPRLLAHVPQSFTPRTVRFMANLGDHLNTCKFIHSAPPMTGPSRMIRWRHQRWSRLSLRISRSLEDLPDGTTGERRRFGFPHALFHRHVRQQPCRVGDHIDLVVVPAVREIAELVL